MTDDFCQAMVTKVAFLLVLWGCTANSHLMKENTVSKRDEENIEKNSSTGTCSDESLELWIGSGLENVECQGTEESLENFTKNFVAYHGCDHNKDAGVDCKPGLEIRLVNGSVAWEGRVEVRNTSINDTWGTVCHDLWEDVDASVVCRQLGIGLRGTANYSTFFGRGTGPIYLDNVECQGTEETLAKCRMNKWGYHDCDHSKDAGVICQPGVEVRLAGGRVEVRSPGLSDIWDSVCNAGWDDAAATVVCRQLGIGNRGLATPHSPLGCSCCPVYLAFVNCTGNESDLWHCNVGPWGSHKCQPGDHAGVVCETDCDPGTFMNASSQTCTPCPAGMFQTKRNSETCGLCPPGRFQRLTGQTSCTPCPTGQHQEQEGQRSCKVCPVGYFQRVTGQPSCAKCPEGTSTSSLGADHPDNCTESPASMSTLTVTMSFSLTVFCTKERALAVKVAICSEVYQIENYTTGVCADPTCSNALVDAWCQSYSSYIVHSEIRFENLPRVTTVSNGTNIPTKELMVQIVKDTPIFQILKGGATLQRNSVHVTETFSCPPNFRISGTSCVHVEDNVIQMVGTAVGCCVALVAVIFLILLLVKLNKRKIFSAINVKASSNACPGPTNEDEAYVYFGDDEAGKADSIPPPMCDSLGAPKIT